jgi:hypothetical protein
MEKQIQLLITSLGAAAFFAFIFTSGEGSWALTFLLTFFTYPILLIQHSNQERIKRDSYNLERMASALERSKVKTEESDSHQE